MPTPPIALVVDDDDDVRRGLALALGRLGYRVSLHADGRDAVDALDRLPQVDLVVTDVRLPRLDGSAVVAHARAIAPGVPVVIVSGVVDANSIVGRALTAADAVLLTKPFEHHEFLEAVAYTRALGACAAATGA